MRIAMIGHKRIPSREGGIEVVVEELAVRMAARGHQVVVYNRKGHNVAGAEFDNESNQNNVPYTYKGVKAVPVFTFDKKGLAALSSSFVATLKAIKSRPDVIHYHAEGPCVPLRLAHWAGIRTVATIHGLDWARAKWGRFASMYLKLGERTAARCADEVIVLSRDMQRYFKDTYGRNTHFIPNGIEPSADQPAAEITRRFGLTAGSYLLFLGRIVPEKGVHYLIEAFKQLDTDQKLVIAGGASDSDEYYAQIQEAAARDPRIVLTGFVEGRTLNELYSNATIYVLPSDLEGMPMSLLEAMSHGRACVTSDIPECAEVLGDCGITFSRGNIDDLAAKLTSLLADSCLIARLGESARHRVRENYDWDQIVDRTLALYTDGDACGTSEIGRGDAR